LCSLPGMHYELTCTVIQLIMGGTLGGSQVFTLDVTIVEILLL